MICGCYLPFGVRRSALDVRRLLPSSKALHHHRRVPRGYIAGVYNAQEWRIDDGSFVKLREVSLSYSLGKFKCFNDLSFSLGGRNLVSWDHYKGYDPEVNAAGQSTVLRGIDFGAVPAPRTYTVSLHAKF